MLAEYSHSHLSWSLCHTHEHSGDSWAGNVQYFGMTYFGMTYTCKLQIRFPLLVGPNFNVKAKIQHQYSTAKISNLQWYSHAIIPLYLFLAMFASAAVQGYALPVCRRCKVRTNRQLIIYFHRTGIEQQLTDQEQKTAHFTCAIVKKQYKTAKELID